MQRQMNLRALASGLAVLLIAASPAAAPAAELRLVDAAAAQDLAAIQRLLKDGADPNAARADGVTALLWAAHWNDLTAVDTLLRAGARVNAADDHGVTALARAAENGGVAVAALLLNQGADPNIAQTSGLTPLMIAAHTGSTRFVQLLIERGADVNRATSESGSTALMWAVADQHPPIVELLLRNKADVKASTVKGFTALMFAARNGDVNTGKQLVEAGADVNALGADGNHVLPYAILAGQMDFAFFLLEHGADPNARLEGIRALHAAAGTATLWLDDWTRRHGGGVLAGPAGRGGARSAARRTELVNALLAKGADPNARITTSAMLMNYIGYPKKGAFEPFACGTGDLRGATPLWVAAYTANGSVGGFGGDGGQGAGLAPRSDSGAEVISALLAGGANLHLATDDGTTPLMVAAGLGRATFSPGLQRARRSTSAEDAVTALLDAGADIHAVNEADFTALHGAAFRGLNEVIQILVDRGANLDARDFRGRTPYRIAEGAKQSFQFQAYPETAAYIKGLGANTRLGIPGTVHERLRDVPAAGNAGN